MKSPKGMNKSRLLAISGMDSRTPGARWKGIQRMELILSERTGEAVVKSKGMVVPYKMKAR
jgi:hypothetical protein